MRTFEMQTESTALSAQLTLITDAGNDRFARSGRAKDDWCLGKPLLHGG